jgi:hypothetical protein
MSLNLPKIELYIPLENRYSSIIGRGGCFGLFLQPYYYLFTMTTYYSARSFTSGSLSFYQGDEIQPSLIPASLFKKLKKLKLLVTRRSPEPPSETIAPELTPHVIEILDPVHGSIPSEENPLDSQELTEIPPEIASFFGSAGQDISSPLFTTGEVMTGPVGVGSLRNPEAWALKSDLEFSAHFYASELARLFQATDVQRHSGLSSGDEIEDFVSLMIDGKGFSSETIDDSSRFDLVSVLDVSGSTWPHLVSPILSVGFFLHKTAEILQSSASRKITSSTTVFASYARVLKEAQVNQISSIFDYGVTGNSEEINPEFLDVLENLGGSTSIFSAIVASLEKLEESSSGLFVVVTDGKFSYSSFNRSLRELEIPEGVTPVLIFITTDENFKSEPYVQGTPWSSISITERDAKSERLVVNIVSNSLSEKILEMK